MPITSYFFNLLSPLQNHANNVLDRGSQFNAGEGKVDRKVKICCNKRILPSQKSTESSKNKTSQN